AFYRQTALFEHASIASFHKFALELMQFGAPPSLLKKVQAAIQDEIEHAQMAFGIASELLGTSVGPHTMSIQPQLAQSLRELAVATFKEGAVGESIAVVLAANQRVKATEPAICAFLERVIADESKHAELAWETLRWCLEQDPSIAEALESIDLNEVVAPYRLSHFTAIPSLGILSGREHTKAVLQGLQNVVQPSLFTLLDAFH
ncbi:MAG: ferritin-like domain-containing protein, partial [Myxococcota bacterium]|nr:ferritin-like domain-containing protein [Myxococcota bacterium]